MYFRYKSNAQRLSHPDDYICSQHRGYYDRLQARKGYWHILKRSRLQHDVGFLVSWTKETLACSQHSRVWKKSHHATQSFKGIGASRARRAHILIVQPIAMLIFKGVKVKVKSSNKSLPSPTSFDTSYPEKVMWQLEPMLKGIQIETST